MTRWRILGFAVLITALLIMLLIGFAPTWLRLALAAYDVENVTFDNLDVGINQSQLRGLKIGDPVDQEVELIQIDYSLASLIGGQLERITIDGLNTRLNLDLLLASEEDLSGTEVTSILPTGAVSKELDLKNSRISVKTPIGLITLPLSGYVKTLDDHIELALMTSEEAPTPAEGAIEIALNVGGKVPLNGSSPAGTLEASGQLSFQIADATWPERADGIDANGLIDFAIEDGALKASTEGMSLAFLPSMFKDVKAFGRLNTKAGRADRPLRVTGQHDGRDWQLRILGPLETSTKAASATAETDIAFNMNDDGELSGLDGWLSLDLDGLSWSSDRLNVEDLTLDQTLRFGLDGRTASVLIEEQGRISLGQLAVPDQVESGWFTVQLRRSETPLLRFDIETGAWHQQLDLELDPVRLETRSGQWWARIEDLQLISEGDLETLRLAEISVGEGRADWPASNIALIGIESEIKLAGDDLLLQPPIPLTIRTIRPLENQEPRPFTPLRLEATAEPEQDMIAFKGRVAASASPDTPLTFRGHHRSAGGQGRLTFDLANLRFVEGGLQPSDLSPFLNDIVEKTSGRVALAGELEWSDGDLSSTADLLVEELGLSIGPARLDRINALFQFDSLIPPTTPEGQELAIALLDVGLPLTDGLVSMQLVDDGKLVVDQLTWRLAGGEVGAEPFSFGSDVQALTMILDVEQLDLNQLLALTELDGLTGEGRIDGKLPLTIDENGVIVADGKLEANDAGILRYRPDEPPSALQVGGESIGLVLQALENFHYDDLDITLNGRTDGETDIDLHIRGANPDLLGGHPIEFNLDLQGNLAALIRANVSNYQIPDRIREKVQGFGR